MDVLTVLESDPVVQEKWFSTRGSFAPRGHSCRGGGAIFCCHNWAESSGWRQGWACCWHLVEETMMLQNVPQCMVPQHGMIQAKLPSVLRGRDQAIGLL